MKTYLIAFLWLVTFGAIKGQLSGTAFLENQTNHSNIRVKFDAQSGTAVTDSCYTDASGNYNISISPGIYIITFRKAGYVDVFYNSNATTLLTNTTVLSGVTLSAGNPVFVYGNVSGTWSGSNTYVVMQDLNIAAGNTLTIPAGAKIIFNGYSSISGNGVVIASGTPANPIKFSSGRQTKGYNDWKQIGLSSTKSSFDNCIFEDASFPINFQSGGTNVTNCIFRHVGHCGIYISSGSPIIENNDFYDVDDPTNGATAIRLEGSATGTVSCNYIHDMPNGIGIILYAPSLAKDNHIKNVRINGIIMGASNSKMINNCISNSEVAAEIALSSTPINPLVANNILFGNQIGIKIRCGGSVITPTIVNNLITGNGKGFTQYNALNGTYVIDHNLVWNAPGSNYDNVQLIGLGQLITTNSAGYQVDTYNNMSQDPLYNFGPPNVTSASPCFGTGNTNYSSKIGFTNPFGCKATVVSIPERNKISNVSIFPNPSSGTFTLPVFGGDDILVNIFDMSGQSVYTELAVDGQKINAEYLPNGVYILKIKSGEVTGTALLAISK